MNTVLSWFWPPLAWRLKVIKWEAEDSTARAAFYRDVYIPWVEAEAQRQLREFREPLVCMQFLKKAGG
jgi:hypothetical protein